MATQSARVLRCWGAAAFAVDVVVAAVVPLFSGSDVLTVAATAAMDMEGGALGRVGLGLFGCLTCGRRMGWKANAVGSLLAVVLDVNILNEDSDLDLRPSLPGRLLACLRQHRSR